MKKLFYLVIIMTVLMLFACGKAKIEDVAKDHVKKQFAFDSPVKVDTSKLKYTVIKKEDDNATVKVSGTIKYEEQIHLIKENGKWRIGKKAASQVEQKKVISHIEQKKETPHTEQKKGATHGEHEVSPKEISHKG